MLNLDRIDVSERIDINNSNKSKECVLHSCYYDTVNFEKNIQVGKKG